MKFNTTYGKFQKVLEILKIIFRVILMNLIAEPRPTQGPNPFKQILKQSL